MSFPRFTIRAMIFAVFLVAADLAALGLAGRHALAGLPLGLFSILPMANLVAVASYRASTPRAPGRPFLIGFVLAGALAIRVWFQFFLATDEGQLTAMLRWYSKTLQDNVRYYLTTDPKITPVFYLIISLTIFMSSSILPQVLVALSGGWIARRYAARSRPAGDQPPARLSSISSGAAAYSSGSIE